MQNKKEILKRCVEKWGIAAQIRMVYEETAELVKELCKYERGRENRFEIIDEITDVSLMLEQLKYIFSITDEELFERENFKLNRIVERLNKD